MHSIVRTKQDWEETLDVSLGDERLQRTAHALMVDPAGFRVEYVINPHMEGPDGLPRVVDPDVARLQWQAVHDTYAELGFAPEVIAADADLPDQVFSANHGLAFPRDNDLPGFVAANMAHPEREAEVPLTTRYMEHLGYRVHHLEAPGRMEGGGDLLWLGDRRVLLGGYGFRSDGHAIAETAAIADAPLLALELVDPSFYHLDTCLTVLDHDTALWVPEAFAGQSRDLLRSVFGILIEPTRADALKLAANAHCPDGNHVLIESECVVTRRQLEVFGYDPIPLDTSEFRKSGGSVTCMRHMIW